MWKNQNLHPTHHKVSSILEPHPWPCTSPPALPMPEIGAPLPPLCPGALGGRAGVQVGEYGVGASQPPLSIQDPAAHSKFCKRAPKAVFKQWRKDTARSKQGRRVFIQIQTYKMKNFIQNQGRQLYLGYFVMKQQRKESIKP